MTLDNDTMQIITLLTSILGLASGLLSFNEKLANVGLLKAIKVFVLCSLPILFIQQIIQITYDTKLYFSIIFLIIAIIWFLQAIYNHVEKNEKIDSSDDKAIIFVIMVSNFLLIFQNQIISTKIENYVVQINDFICDLATYRISLELYSFLSQNLFCTISILFDCINIILLILVDIYGRSYYKCYFALNIFELSIEIKWRYKSFVTAVLYCLFFSTGFPKIIINWVLGLF